jgi:hypothetical protein
VPISFITLASYYFFEGRKQMKDDVSIFSSEPELILEISYEDIGGEKYTANYTLRVNLGECKLNCVTAL